MTKDRLFGEIANVSVGRCFSTRLELAQTGIHRPLQAGISGSEKEGADSIVLSGGYEDDLDFGNVIIYTGHGGRDENSKTQTQDQTLSRQNKALAISYEYNYPIRVIRGANKHSKFAPAQGYRYDGLYKIDDYWHEKGKSGFLVWKFRLVKLDNDAQPIENKQSIVEEQAAPYQATNRKEQTIYKIVRNTTVRNELKQLYDYKCQICNIQIKSPIGFYIEAAHIKALGIPHNGVDAIENMICLCPNHHKMFDLGVIAIDDNFNIIGDYAGKLTVHQKHRIDKEFIKYHREHHFKPQ